MNSSLTNDARNARLVFYNANFDNFFIFGTFTLASVLGILASISHTTLMMVVFLDIWLFANPHVIATYTRIASNTNQIKRNWFLIFILPILIFFGVTFTVLAYEISGLFTLYLIAQTYHVSRQSFGIARAYRRIDSHILRSDRLSEILIYIFPLWGLLNWCAQSPDTFLSYPIKLPVIPLMIVHIFGVMTIVLSIFWVIKLCIFGIRRMHDWFVISHLCIFCLAYLWISDITLGWLIINIWHNIQYLLFVWLKNNKQKVHFHNVSSELPNPNGSNTDFISPWKNARNYLVLCLSCGAVLYELLNVAGSQLLWLGLPAVLIMHFTINFHHYLVDGVIWKCRRLP